MKDAIVLPISTLYKVQSVLRSFFNTNILIETVGNTAGSCCIASTIHRNVRIFIVSVQLLFSPFQVHLQLHRHTVMLCCVLCIREMLNHYFCTEGSHSYIEWVLLCSSYI